MLIKRYPNRKLYNTQSKRYITLDCIADLLRENIEVHVVDYASGEDVTTQVLSQVIAGQEKKRSGFIPRPVLAGLVQAGGATIDGLRRAMLLPLDILRQVDDEIQHRIEKLIQRGDVTEAEGMHWLDRLLS
jgi:polyhydroxyalkanoate synthesis repressor PhaR